MSKRLLMDHIERAVRPVRANPIRKEQMREELAAHLAASFEEERARLGDERAAAEQAIRRLGEVDELSRSLQESVPRLERMLFTPLPKTQWLEALDRAWYRKVVETPIHHAARVTFWTTAAIAIADLIVMPVAVAMNARPLTDWSVTLVWAVASLVVVAAGAFASPLLCEGIVRALRRGSSGRSRAMLLAGSSSLGVIILGLAFVLIVSVASPHGQLFRQSDWLRLLAVSLVAPPSLIVAARSAISRRRRQDGWGILETSN